MILLVDDDAVFLRSAERVLAPEEGVLFASNGNDALALMKAIRFSVALVDLDLPSPGGFELIQRIRATAPHLPIIAISGVFSYSVLESAKEFGAVEILQKPVTPDWA